jgi:serine/threonine protein kinase/tetratricopeptide (TPR) repeat protein
MSTRIGNQDAPPAPGPESVSISVSMDFAAARGLKRQLLAELQASHEEGAPVPPEQLLPRWPSNPAHDDDIASLLFEDFQQRRQMDGDASIADYEQRFPNQKDSLAALVRRDAVLRSLRATHGSSTSTLSLPAVGDELFGFQLRQELGRGAFARVFLAEQADLAGRPVVLKVSGIDGNEPQTLAQLQHTNIVPIYSVHEDSQAGLRAVCMPYFGGASLSQVLRVLHTETDMPTAGQQLADALANCASHSSDFRLQSAAHYPAICNLQSAICNQNYLRAVVWIVARLAEALQHAHERGVLHRDIKPSNILLAADGEPMLLDFNLAQTAADDPGRATLGGTVAYMAPEHLRAMAKRDPEQARQVGRPADIYSLGMVLYEMLTGRSPFDQSASYHLLPALIESMAAERAKCVPSLLKPVFDFRNSKSETRNPKLETHAVSFFRIADRGLRILRRPPAKNQGPRPDAPWSLESIVRKCLAPDQSKRYSEAKHLAADLHRFLDDLPLKHAPELSRTERIHKWVRRHPRVTSSGAVAVAAALLLMGVGAALIGVKQHLKRTSEELKDVQSLEQKRAYEAGAERALCLVNTKDELRDHLREGIAVCEQTLALFGILDHDDWQQRPDWKRLDDAVRQRLAEETRELLMLLAWARVQVSLREETEQNSEPSFRQALDLLTRAEAIEGLAPSQALWKDRAVYLGKLGDYVSARAAEAEADRMPPVSARDYYLLATAHSRNRRYKEAVNDLDRALRLSRKHYWSWFQRGICHLELGDNATAAADFGVCIGLWPDFAWGYFNRGCALYRGGNRAEAVKDYDAALRCDPGFLDAYINRGLARRELGQNEEALADFERAAWLGCDAYYLHAERGYVLEKLGRHSKADAAFKTALALSRSERNEARAAVLLNYGFAVSARAPESAAEAFDEVQGLEPLAPRPRAQAHYGRAMLVAERQPRAAIEHFGQAIQVDPSLLEARRYRGILEARLGDFETASQDITWCLEREPNSGGTLYAAACITALAVKKLSGPAATQLAARAIDLLQQAFAHGYGRDKAGEDPDLAALRGDAGFKQLLSKNPKSQIRNPK